MNKTKYYWRRFVYVLEEILETNFLRQFLKYRKTRVSRSKGDDSEEV